MTTLEAALRQFDATEANLRKLEKLHPNRLCSKLAFYKQDEV